MTTRFPEVAHEARQLASRDEGDGSGWSSRVAETVRTAGAHDQGTFLVAHAVLARVAAERAAETKRRARYGIGFFPAYVRFWKKYATFSGRASRGEYWWPFLANLPIIVALHAILINDALGGPESRARVFLAPLTMLIDASYNSHLNPSEVGWVALVLLSIFLVPMLAVTWRRMHDIDESGGYTIVVMLLFGFLPVFGHFSLIALVSMLGRETVP